MKKNLKYFLIIFIPLTLLFLGSSFVFYRMQVHPQRQLLKAEERDLTESFVIEISNELENISKDIIVLSRLSSIKRNPVNNVGNLADIEDDFLSFSGARKKYDQVRLLDQAGDEIIRVNLKDGKAILEPAEKLQNKAERYYFQGSVKLGRNKIYLSPLDLNIEHGEVEIPYKPMIRFATPVFRGDKTLAGVVVLNYFADYILEFLDRGNVFHKGRYNLMTNKDGYWLKGLDKNDEFGFMFNKDVTFRDNFPKEWEIIGRKEQGQFETPAGLFTFRTIYPVKETQLSDDYLGLIPDEYCWKIITYLPNTVFYSGSKRLLNLLIPFVLVLVFFGFIVSFLLAQSIQKKIESRRELIEAAEIKSKFTSIAAHELKNPLAAISEGINLVYEEIPGPINDKQRKLLAITKRQIEQVVKMSVDFLDFQKIEMKKMEFSFAENDLNELLASVYEVYKPTAASRGVEFNLRLSENVPGIKFDRDRMEEVAVNLLNNAFKFTKQGSVTVASVVEPGKVHVKISDTGTGIRKEDIPVVFEAFKQASDAPAAKGAGLGMFIAKEIIVAHGGSIWVESDFGKGTTFHFTLPISIVDVGQH